MNKNNRKILTEVLKPKVKLVERDCPRCDSLIMQNEKEDCYECLKCGYIDCGDITEYLQEKTKNKQ